jgi:hypothetical protein
VAKGDAVRDRTRRRQIDVTKFSAQSPRMTNKSTVLALTMLAAHLATTQAIGLPVTAPAGKIDRHALVTRHKVILTNSDPKCILQAGNGEIAFGVDVTGLQTFYGNTLSQWAWHKAPLPPGERVENFQWTMWDHAGRNVPYQTPSGSQKKLTQWMYVNPSRLPLGRLSMRLIKADGQVAGLQDLKDIHQELDLWSGRITSQYSFEGQSVRVETCGDPQSGALAVRIESPLVAFGRIGATIAFPYADQHGMGDWKRPEAHQTSMTLRGANRADFARIVDSSTYAAALEWSAGTVLQPASRVRDDTASALQSHSHRHQYDFLATGTNRMDLVCSYSPAPISGELPTVEAIFAASATHWKNFWLSGGALDLSGSKDPRWHELERRIVLSQYLMAVNAAGSLPPQESGLVNNSGWSGKLHLEMYWWHAAQYALWDRWELWNRSLGYLQTILPQARAIAEKQGYKGVRWPKMIGPDAVESPNGINPLLIWQQPHPIFYAELDYRAHPTLETLARWKEIVFSTADFMASYADYDDASGHYVLGPPLKTVPEITDAKTSKNPAFELSYWQFGLRTAQLWRERLGLARDPAWDKVLKNLAPLPQQSGIYLMQEGLSDTYTKWNRNHPSVVGISGMLPGDGSDPAVMKATLSKTKESWRWDQTWGWDFPLIAMCAARNGDPHTAVEMLLTPAKGFQFNACGLPTGGPFPYLPSNGGLLYAVAMMAAGWDGAPAEPAPGFPNDGSWVVKWEGLKKAP